MKKQISSRQLGIMVFIYMLVMNAEISIRIMTKLVKQDMWISFLISRTLGFLMLLLIIRIVKKLKDRTIFHVNVEIAGKYIGNFINLLFVGIFYFLAALIIYQYIDMIIINFMFSSSKLTLTILFIIVALYGVFQGVEALFRASEIVFVVILVTYIILFPTNPREIDLLNFLPIFNNEIQDLAKATLFDFSYSCIGLIFLLAFPTSVLSKDSNYEKNLIAGYLFAFILTGLVIFTQVYGIGPLLLAKYNFPILISTHGAIEVYFIERLGFISNFSEFWGSILLVALFLHLFFEGIENVFRVKKNIFIALALAASLAYVSVNTFPSSIDFNNFFTNQLVIYLPLIILIYPILLSLTLDIRALTKNTKKR